MHHYLVFIQSSAKNIAVSSVDIIESSFGKHLDIVNFLSSMVNAQDVV